MVFRDLAMVSVTVVSSPISSMTESWYAPFQSMPPELEVPNWSVVVIFPETMGESTSRPSIRAAFTASSLA